MIPGILVPEPKATWLMAFLGIKIKIVILGGPNIGIKPEVYLDLDTGRKFFPEMEPKNKQNLDLSHPRKKNQDFC